MLELRIADKAVLLKTGPFPPAQPSVPGYDLDGWQPIHPRALPPTRGLLPRLPLPPANPPLLPRELWNIIALHLGGAERLTLGACSWGLNSVASDPIHWRQLPRLGVALCCLAVGPGNWGLFAGKALLQGMRPLDVTPNFVQAAGLWAHSRMATLEDGFECVYGGLRTNAIGFDYYDINETRVDVLQALGQGFTKVRLQHCVDKQISDLGPPDAGDARTVAALLTLKALAHRFDAPQTEGA